MNEIRFTHDKETHFLGIFETVEGWFMVRIRTQQRTVACYYYATELGAMRKANSILWYQCGIRPFAADIVPDVCNPQCYIDPIHNMNLGNVRNLLKEAC